MEKIKNIVKEGNSCIFAVFIIFNFLLFLVALGILGCAIYLFAFTFNANVFNISFLIISVVLFVFTVCAFKMRRSIHLLGFYLFILCILFLFQLIITIVVMVNKQKLIDWATEHMDS
jgi:hypothetical protein